MTSKGKMSTSRKIAIIVGVLYLTSNAAGIVDRLFFEGPILNVPDYLVNIAAHETQWTIGVLLGFWMAVCLAGIGLVFYPILKQHSEIGATLYAGARVIEGTLWIVVFITSQLTLLTVGQEYVKAGSPADSYFQTLGEQLLGTFHWGDVLSGVVFCLGAPILYYTLYQSKLIPRWIGGLGFVGAILNMAAVLLALFGLIETMSAIDNGLQVPLLLSEIIMPIWLLVKGFNPSAIVSEPV